MEFSTSSIELESSEIKPSAGLKDYLKKLEADVREYFLNRVQNTAACPSCKSPKSSKPVTKLGINYLTCDSCLTIFASERPSQEEIARFFTKSVSREFWLREIWKTSESARLHKIVEPTIDWIRSHFSSKYSFAELNPSHPGFLQSWNGAITAVAPHMPSNFLPNKNEKVVGLDTTEQFDAIGMFDALDRAYSPRETLQWAHSHLNPKGFCFITGILSTGLDTLVQGARSNSIIPPDRFNSFSYEGLVELAENVGFEIVEFSTPGALDVENLSRALASQPSSNDFLNYALNVRKSETLKLEFQEFLQKNQLSSRARLALRKK